MRFSAPQQRAVDRLEAEHGPADCLTGGLPNPAVFVDFHTRTEEYRSFRVDQDGDVVDVTAAMLLDDFASLIEGEGS